MEPCCGTHVLNTGDIQGFVILSHKSNGVGHKIFKCITGNRAVAARNAGLELIKDVTDLNDEMETADVTDDELVCTIYRVHHHKLNILIMLSLF